MSEHETPERACKRCRKVEPWALAQAFAVASPSGVLHIGEDDGDTACGIDATGDDWRWPE